MAWRRPRSFACDSSTQRNRSRGQYADRIHAHIFGFATGSLEILVGTALMIGFLTPIAGACASLDNLVNGVSWSLTSGGNSNAIVFLYLVVICVAITLLGPGAFSLDARLFGRREIIIPERSSATVSMISPANQSPMNGDGMDVKPSTSVKRATDLDCSEEVACPMRR